MRDSFEQTRPGIREPRMLPSPLTADIRAMFSGHGVGLGVGPGHEVVDAVHGVTFDESRKGVGRTTRCRNVQSRGAASRPGRILSEASRRLQAVH